MQVRLSRWMSSAVVAAVVSVLLAGCAGPVQPLPSAPSEVADAPSPSGALELPTLRTLIDLPAESPALTEVGPLDGGGSVVSYESGGFTVTGALFAPDGEGPFPGAVLVHGLVDASYTTGSELVRERDRLVERGFVVLAPDLRSFGGSDTDPATGADLEMGDALDTVNGLRALAADPRVDPRRIVLIGHSLGGLAALDASVVAPGLAAAVIALAPASTDVWENVTSFLAPGDDRWDAIVGPRGTQEQNPQLWADVSPRTFVARADAPLLIVQGTADDTVDPAWATATADVWRAAGKSVQLVEVPGADHVFDPHWDEAMAAIEAFLAASGFA